MILNSRNLKRQALTVFIAVIGSLIFLALNMPLPFLFGSMVSCLIAALAGLNLKGLGTISVVARAILGVAIGASITPQVLSQLPQMAASVAFIPLFIIVIALIGVPFFKRIFGLDPVTSWYAAMPGGLQDMVLFGTEAGGDQRALSLIHATRVLMVVTVAPIFLRFAFDAEFTNPVGLPASDIPLLELVIMIIAGLVGWKAFERAGLFGAPIIGPMILTAILSLTDVLHYRPPAEAIETAQFLIGIGIGVGYVGVTILELRKFVLAGVLFVFILAALAAIFSQMVTALGLANPVEAFLAFAPGGQAEMTVLALVVGADLGFVIVHHLTRVVLVILGAPLAARFYRNSKPD
ncbi:MAG: AbrB family transcriptional regulator [Rhizobiaceae bacterium]